MFKTGVFIMIKKLCSLSVTGFVQFGINTAALNNAFFIEVSLPMSDKVYCFYAVGG